MEKPELAGESPVELERKVAYIRLATILCVSLGIFLFYKGQQKIHLLLGFSVVVLYALAVIMAINCFKERLQITSIFITFLDTALISSAVTITGVDGYLTQLYFISIATVALRFSLRYTIFMAFINIAGMSVADLVHCFFLSNENAVQEFPMKHLYWGFYILITALVTGLISEQVRKTKLEKDELNSRKLLIENEMAVTAEMQRSLLPNHVLKVNGLQMKYYYSPSMYVSGDYADFFCDDKGLYYLLIADIMGGGLSRGFLSLGLRSAVRVIANEETDSAAVMSRLNKHICSNYSELNCFVTMHLVILDFETNCFNSCIAGHFSPMIWVRGQYMEVNSDNSGLALGIDPDEQYCSYCGELKKGILTLLYTDGIIEARNKENVPFGKERLKKSAESYLASAAQIEIEKLERKIRDDLSEYTESVGWRDDWSLLIFYYS